MNALLFAFCISVALAGMGEAGATLAGVTFRNAIPAAYAVHSWLALAALLCSNAVFHLVGTYQMRRYSPGAVTGVVLYAPLALFGFWYFVARGEISLGFATVAVLLGGSYHLWAHLLHASRAE